MDRFALSAALKAVFRPKFRGFEREIDALKGDTAQITTLITNIDKRLGTDRAIDDLTEGKGE
ncbi:MAG: hypothetical protein CL808_02695 [Citromicrobium sp.]|nr:hypothetical protein [Citromicrobium sp.]